MSNEFTITDFQLYRECAAMAKEIFEDHMNRNPGSEPEELRDDMMDSAHETADAHEYVIYNFQAGVVCAYCNVNDGEQQYGEISDPNADFDLDRIHCAIAYLEMKCRIESALDELIDEWEAEESES